jgi:Transposase, Mutator family
MKGRRYSLIVPLKATLWTAFLRKLARRGLRGVKLVISDAHEGINAAVARVLHASWQRCRVHFMRNVLAHAGKSGQRVVSAFIATAFAQDDASVMYSYVVSRLAFGALAVIGVSIVVFVVLSAIRSSQSSAARAYLDGGGKP